MHEGFLLGLVPMVSVSEWLAQAGMPLRSLEGERAESQHIGKWTAILHCQVILRAAKDTGG